MDTPVLDIVDPEQLSAEPAWWDGLAAATPGIDVFCSSTPWMLAAFRGLMPGRTMFLARGAEGALALAEHRLPGGRTVWEPLEAMWAFGCPAVGADPDATLAAGLRALGLAQPAWRAVILSGLPLDPDPLRRIARVSPVPGTARLLGRSRRSVASLEGGFEGWLSRRSGGFRNNLARSRRKAVAAGVAVQVVRDLATEADALAALERALAIESSSWKGRRKIGIDTGGMRDFYRHMLPILAGRGALRFVWVTHAGRDIAYHFGGVLGGAYRGLQHSFADDRRELAPGVIAHAAAIEAACDEGIVDYDLGQETAYKTRWAESTFVTASVALVR